MISVFNYKTAHLFGDILPKQHRVRYDSFISRCNYNVLSYDKMEFDQYDTPATTYLCYTDDFGNVLTTSRMNPTVLPYMIEELWPNLVKGEIPKQQDVWEGSRICINKDLPSPYRKKVAAEIVCASLEYSLKNNISRVLGVMHPLVWKSVFINSGWDIEFLGDITTLDSGDRVVAGAGRVTEEMLQNVRNVTGIDYPVIVDENNVSQIRNKLVVNL